jgi:hypothetical protein
LILQGPIAFNRGRAKRVPGGTILQYLTAQQLSWFLPKPNNIRVDEVFDSTANKDTETLLYCAHDGDADHHLYHSYIQLPNLTIRCKEGELMSGDLVDITSQKKSATNAITVARVVQGGKKAST